MDSGRPPPPSIAPSTLAPFNVSVWPARGCPTGRCQRGAGRCQPCPGGARGPPQERHAPRRSWEAWGPPASSGRACGPRPSRRPSAPGATAPLSHSVVYVPHNSPVSRSDSGVCSSFPDLRAHPGVRFRTFQHPQRRPCTPWPSAPAPQTTATGRLRPALGTCPPGPRGPEQCPSNGWLPPPDRLRGPPDLSTGHSSCVHGEGRVFHPSAPDVPCPLARWWVRPPPRSTGEGTGSQERRGEPAALRSPTPLVDGSLGSRHRGPRREAAGRPGAGPQREAPARPPRGTGVGASGRTCPPSFVWAGRASAEHLPCRKSPSQARGGRGALRASSGAHGDVSPRCAELQGLREGSLVPLDGEQAGVRGGGAQAGRGALLSLPEAGRAPPSLKRGGAKGSLLLLPSLSLPLPGGPQALRHHTKAPRCTISVGPEVLAHHPVDGWSPGVIPQGHHIAWSKSPPRHCHCLSCLISQTPGRRDSPLGPGGHPGAPSVPAVSGHLLGHAQFPYAPAPARSFQIGVGGGVFRPVLQVGSALDLRQPRGGSGPSLANPPLSPRGGLSCPWPLGPTESEPGTHPQGVQPQGGAGARVPAGRGWGGHRAFCGRRNGCRRRQCP